MTKSRWILLALLLSAGAGSILATPGQTPASSARPPGTNYKGPAFTFNKIAEGIYHAVGQTGSTVVVERSRDRNRPRRPGSGLARDAGRRLGAS
jgi:hypothetical protein